MTFKFLFLRTGARPVTSTFGTIFAFLNEQAGILQRRFHLSTTERAL